MTRTINAVYQGGVLRPLESLAGLEENARVRLTVESVEGNAGSLADCIGSMPDEDADEMRRIIECEFEQVNPAEWS